MGQGGSWYSRKWPGNVSEGKNGKLPPTPWGPFVFSCGDCRDKWELNSGRFEDPNRSLGLTFFEQG